MRIERLRELPVISINRRRAAYYPGDRYDVVADVLYDIHGRAEWAQLSPSLFRPRRETRRSRRYPRRHPTRRRTVGLLDKAKAAAEQAAAKAKEGVHEVQTKRELGQAYDELGQAVFDLVEKGDLTDARLTTHVDKIRELRKQLEEGDSAGAGAGAGAGAASGETPPSDEPPAMPT
jgi:hypothetical protein